MKDSDFKNAKCNSTKGFTKRACLVHSFGSTSLFAKVPNLKCYDECFHSNVLIGKTVSKHSPLKCFGNTSLFANVPGSFCAAAASKSHQIHPFLI